MNATEHQRLSKQLITSYWEIVRVTDNHRYRATPILAHLQTLQQQVADTIRLLEEQQ